MNTRETDLQGKLKGDPNYSNNFLSKTSSSSRRWSIHKNPRIVRVSRAFGGKDRHSKVCTVKGLRDRRIRLSVPTAIQLYDLQDRLGVNQPSKVLDWLLDATKTDIDKLPPLPTLPLFANLTHQPLVPSPHLASNPQSHFLTSNHPYAKDLGINPSKNENVEGKDKWITSRHQESLVGFAAQLSAQNLFPLTNQSAFPSIPYNPYFHLDHPNMSLTQFGGAVYPNFPNQTDDQSSIHPSNPQLYFCPSSAALPSLVPSFPPLMNNDMRQINPTTLNLISSPIKSCPQDMNSQKVQHHGKMMPEDRKRTTTESLEANKFSGIL